MPDKYETSIYLPLSLLEAQSIIGALRIATINIEMDGNETPKYKAKCEELITRIQEAGLLAGRGIPGLPDKFIDRKTGAPRIDLLLSSYLALEKKLSAGKCEHVWHAGKRIDADTYEAVCCKCGIIGGP